MSIKKLTIAMTAICCLISTAVQAQFYYGADGPIELLVDSSKVLVQTSPSLTPLQQQALLESINRIEEVVDDPNTIDDFVLCSLNTTGNYSSFVDSLRSVPGIRFAESFYTYESGTPLYLGQSVVVAFDTLVGQSVIDSIVVATGATMERQLVGLPAVYLIRNSESSGLSSLDLANQTHLLPETRYAHPLFGLRVQRFGYTLYDHYHTYQRHTKKVIGQFNQASVWDFSGLTDTVVVAIIDDGVAPHEDLPASRVLPGYDFAGNDTWAVGSESEPDSDPTPGPLQAHGMACAGIVGASHTTDSAEGQMSSSGMVAVDPHVTILPVKIFDDAGWGATADRVAEAIAYSQNAGADVLSCSWGWSDPSTNIPVVSEALERATLFGREGRGCVAIFAAGNGAEWYSGVGYPARLDFCFAVGATELDDGRWYYSQYGSTLDIVAPSGELCLQGDVWSLDQMGMFGYNPEITEYCPGWPDVTWNCGSTNNTSYDCRFGGTSAACPLVSGTAALLLSKDPTLSAAAVYYILRNSAETNLDWGTITPPHEQYGHGRLDAFRAVLSISRGDYNSDGAVNIADMTSLVGYLYSGNTPAFPSPFQADCDCDGAVNISDMTYLISHMYAGGPPPVSPCFKPWR